MKTIEFINQLQNLDRGFFTISDLEKITNLSKPSLKVALSRLVKQNILVRLKKGVYQLSLNYVDTRKIASQIYYPSYLSFESALSDYGILSQIPYTQTFATIKKSKKFYLQNTEVEFTQIKSDLFWGYELKNGIYIAEPEKALLDELYLISRGKRSINYQEFDLSIIDKSKYHKYRQKYPKNLKLLPAL